MGVATGRIHRGLGSRPAYTCAGVTFLREGRRLCAGVADGLSAT